jgi:DmsE family decaheme c-type cytochrome
MRQHIRALSLTGGLAILVLGAAALALHAEEAITPGCADCHDELVAAFGKTLHGMTGEGAPSCVTCHGDGAKHMDEGGDTTLIVKPSGASGAAICSGCHAGQLHRGFSGGAAAHAAASVTCMDCHAVHNPDVQARFLLRKEPGPLCASCHPAQVTEFQRPFGHRLDRAGVECVSCHDPHAGTGAHSLRTDSSGDIACLTCHAEKRGPFVYSHVTGVTGTCMSCHQPHGSSNPMQLTRASVDQLCLECHSPIAFGTLGSQPPSSHDLLSPRFRNCTICHAAVHGSNSSPALLK